jgi:hypothetical protein
MMNYVLGKRARNYHMHVKESTTTFVLVPFAHD